MSTAWSTRLRGAPSFALVTWAAAFTWRLIASGDALGSAFDAFGYAIVVAAAANVLFARARRPAACASLPSRRELLVAGVVCLSVAALANAALLRVSGVPALHHDWSIPPDGAGLRHLFAATTATWNEQGYGSPKTFPTLYPLYFALSGLAIALSPQVVVDSFLLATIVLAGTACYAAIRCIGGAGPVEAAVGATLFAFSPYTVDEFVAGHLAALLSYSLLPCIALAFTVAHRTRRPAFAIPWLALLLAISAAQLQYIAFDWALLLALLATVDGRPALQRYVAGSVALSLLAIAQSLGHLVGAPPSSDSVGNTTIAWLYDLSVHAIDVFRLGGYIGHYSDVSYPGFVLGSIRTIAATALGLIVIALSSPRVFETRRAGALAAVCVAFGIVGETGLFEPFGAVKSFLFEHIQAFTVFREFYNVAGIVTLGFSFAIAAWLTDGEAHLRKFTPALVIVAVFASVGLSGKDEALLPRVEPSTALAELSRSKLQDDGSRIAMFPLVGPMRRPGATRGAGIDPDWLGIDRHPSVYEWQPGRVNATAQMLLAAGSADRVPALLGAYGVRYVAIRSDLISALPNSWITDLFAPDWETTRWSDDLARAPALVRRGGDGSTTIFENHAAHPIVLVTRTSSTCDSSRFVDWFVAGRCRGDSSPSIGNATTVPLPQSATTYNPHDAWVSAASANWAFGLAVAEAGSATLVTTSASALLTTTFAGDSHAKLFVRCSTTGELDARLDGASSVVACRDPLLRSSRWAPVGVVRDGINVVTFANRGKSAIVMLALARSIADLSQLDRSEFAFPDAASRTTFKRVRDDLITGSYRCDGACVLLFSDTFDPRWTLRFDGGGAPVTARRINLVSNGFSAPAGAHTFELSFDPGWFDRGLGAIEFLFWPTILLAGVIAARFDANTRAMPPRTEASGS